MVIKRINFRFIKRIQLGYNNRLLKDTLNVFNGQLLRASVLRFVDSAGRPGPSESSVTRVSLPSPDVPVMSAHCVCKRPGPWIPGPAPGRLS